MKKYAVWTVTFFSLAVINTISKYISADFYRFYQSAIEFALIFILTNKFVKWVFKDFSKDCDFTDK